MELLSLLTRLAQIFEEIIQENSMLRAVQDHLKRDQNYFQRELEAQRNRIERLEAKLEMEQIDD